jgi:hypothetical protein
VAVSVGVAEADVLPEDEKEFEVEADCVRRDDVE